MYAQVEKQKKNTASANWRKNRSVANAIGQKKTNVKQGVGFADNRPEVDAQRKLNEMTNGNQNVKQMMIFKRMTVSFPPQQKNAIHKKNTNNVVQRKLHTKNGEYDHSDKLPKTEKVNMALVGATNNQAIWFVENDADILAIGSAKGAQLVTPRVHIIGENHNASKWNLLKNKWGYTKKIAYEDLAESKTVKSSETAYHLAKDPDRTKNTIIENLHAKLIIDLAVVLYGSKRLKAIYSNWEQHLRKGEETEATKMKNMGESTRRDVIMMLSDFDFYWKMDYIAASKVAQSKEKATRSKAETILMLMIERHGEQISKDIKSVKESPIGTFTFRDTSKANDIKAWLDKADQLTKNIDELIAFLQDLIELETEQRDEVGMRDAMNEQKKRIGAIGVNTSNEDVLDSASPLREHAMTLALRKMGAPSIALMGMQHKINLEKVSPIPEDEYYDSYDDFVNKTTSKT